MTRPRAGLGSRQPHRLRPQAPAPYRLEDLVVRGSLDLALERLLTSCVRAALNIVISGEPGSGKATLLNALSVRIPADERPERAMVADLRASEALDLLNAMARGPGGALATVRTASADETLPTLTALAGQGTPAASPAPVAATAGHAVDLIVHLELASDGMRRVAEVAQPLLQRRHFGLATLASFEPAHGESCGRFRHYPLPARLTRRLRARGEPIPPDFRSPAD